MCMSDIFISYARSTEKQARAIAEALRAMGYGVWRDDEIPAHRAFSEVIEERLRASKAVVVVWSADAMASEWVRSEATLARADRKLVQLSVDGTKPPMPFEQIQCAELAGWEGDAAHPGWARVTASVRALVGAAGALERPSKPTPKSRTGRVAICVLPFANMSGDPEQEYFSDGISEDIITDLSKVSALEVCARNTAFGFKGKSPNVKEVAQQLGVSHVLEGSVRKAGGRVRITAQLIDGATGNHLWAERYDRDLIDIFALQDEISEAIVKALKLKLLPEEKAAIERRGTDNADAYNLYLMARRLLISGNRSDARFSETVLRLCRRAIEIDPDYAQAWALTALAETDLRFADGKPDDGLAAAERAIALDPGLAEARAVRARHLLRLGRHDEAATEIALALRLDPESYEVNMSAGMLSLRRRAFTDAITRYEKATALEATAVGGPGMLVTCYGAIGDAENARRMAHITVERAEAAMALDPTNGSVMGFAVSALGALGEAERAREWMGRALLIDPDNMEMRYNFACALSSVLGDVEGAVDLLVAYFETARLGDVSFSRVDVDLDPLREDPRFQAMVAAAEARLATGNPADGAGA
jgi:adenylate cyclase